MISYFKISKKSRYALRALLQLALLNSKKPVGVRKIADKQDIPVRFLEVILSELRQGGFVLSVRGKLGGYLLSRKPEEIAVGEVVRFIESIDDQRMERWEESRIKQGDFSEASLFKQIDEAISEILDNTTLKEMSEQERMNRDAYIGNYII